MPQVEFPTQSETDIVVIGAGPNGLIAAAYLSRAGRDIVEKRIKDGGGAALLLDSGKLAGFLALVEADARAADDHARIDEMIDLMKSEIAGRLAV